jgi:hypothetical protein
MTEGYSADKSRALIFSWLLLTVLPAALYVHGHVYYSSYLQTFGLDSAFFPIDWLESLYVGYLIGVTSGGAYVLRTLTIAVVVAALIVVAFFAYALVAKPKVKRAEAPPNAEVSPVIHFWAAIQTVELFAKIVGITVLLISALILLLVSAIRLGEGQASAKIAAFRSAQPDDKTLLSKATISLGEGSETRTFTGYRITCSENYCAVFIEGCANDYCVEIIPIEHLRSIKTFAIRRTK